MRVSRAKELIGAGTLGLLMMKKNKGKDLILNSKDVRHGASKNSKILTLTQHHDGGLSVTVGAEDGSGRMRRKMFVSLDAATYAFATFPDSFIFSDHSSLKNGWVQISFDGILGSQE